MSGYGVMSVIPDYKGKLLIWEVPDPIGQPMSVYREVREIIDRRVDALAKALKNAAPLPEF